MSSPSKKSDQNKLHAINYLLQCSMSSAYLQKQRFYNMWTCDFSSKQYRGKMVYQTMHWSNKKRYQSIDTEIRWVDNEISNMCESPIACDTLLITDAEFGVKGRVPKLLLECSMRQLHNEVIASPYDGGLIRARHANNNDVIIIDTMLRSLALPQLRPITDHDRIMCGYAICNTSKYFQESSNAWKRKKSKS